MYSGIQYVSSTNNQPVYPILMYPARETFSPVPSQEKVHYVAGNIPQFFPLSSHIPGNNPHDISLPSNFVGQEMFIPRNILFQQSEEVTAFMQPLNRPEELASYPMIGEKDQTLKKNKRKFEGDAPTQVEHGVEERKLKKAKYSPESADSRRINTNNGELQRQTVPLQQGVPFILPGLSMVEEQDITADEIVDIAADQVQGPHFPLIADDDYDLLPLSENYRDIEGPTIRFERKDVHFYPTDKVRKAYKKFLVEQASNNKLTFEKFVNRREVAKTLNIQEDTTLYPPEKFLVDNKMAHIFNNQIVRKAQHEPLKIKAKHIFVVDAQGRLMIATKELKGKHGRTQHSSLAQGTAVRVAGMMSLKENGVYSFENLSGHYKPGYDALPEVARWITRQGFTYNVVTDEAFDHPHAGRTRRLELRLT